MSVRPGFLGVILAAGRGTRLGALTADRSKAMLPVAGLPMIGRVLQMLAADGCDEFIVVAHPSDAELATYLRESPWSGSVQVVHQADRLGMAHALECANGPIRASGQDDFVLASCDNVFPAGHTAMLVEKRRAGQLDAAVTLLRVTPAQVPTLAIVELRDGLVTSIVEKPRPEEAPSDLGVPSLHALSVRVLSFLEHVRVSSRGEREFPDAFRLLVAHGGRVGGVMVGWRQTLTRPLDLVALNEHYLRRDHARVEVAQPAPPDTILVPPVRIEPGVALEPGCTVGPAAMLEGGCRVGQGATIARSVVLRGAYVAPHTRVEDQAVPSSGVDAHRGRQADAAATGVGCDT